MGRQYIKVLLCRSCSPLAELGRLTRLILQSLSLGLDMTVKGNVASRHQLVGSYCRSLDKPKVKQNHLEFVDDKSWI